MLLCLCSAQACLASPPPALSWTKAQARSFSKRAIASAAAHGQIKLEPPLPAWKQSAIDRLDMGVLNKVYLKFSEIFWDEEVETISYVGGRVV